jgi:hypothetical protein
VLDRQPGDDPLRRGAVLCALGEARQRAGDVTGARAVLEEAVGVARAAGAPELLALAALAMAGVGVTILHVDAELAELLEEALDALGDDGDVGLRVRLLARLAIALAYAPDPVRRQEASTAALELARAVDQPALLATALSARHVTRWGPDHTAERLTLATEMLAVAQRAGDPELALQARNWRVVDLLELGDGPGVRAELDAYAALAAEVRLPAFTWYVPMWRATLAFLEGRMEEGFALSRRAREAGLRAGDANARVFAAEHDLMRLEIQDRLAELEPLATVDPEVAARARTGPARRSYELTFAWIAAEQGNPGEARRRLYAALDGGLAALPDDVNRLPSLCSAARACIRLGDTELARELRAALEPYAELMIVAGRGSHHGGPVAALLAGLAERCGEPEEADRLSADAIRRAEVADAPALAARERRHHAARVLARRA